MEKVIIVVGPTGIGKSKCAVALAKHYKTEIINGDAFQTYKKMSIGTAKPTKDDMQGIKHHLIDINNPSDEFSVASYQKQVRSLITKLNQKKKIPIIVGGSGLYIDAVIKDYRFDAKSRDTNIELKLQDTTNEELHEMLSRLDYETACEIHPNNRKRVLRAIELVLSSASKDDRNKGESLIYDACILYLTTSREELYERINNRVDEMILNGLVKEAKRLYDNKINTQATKAIGYKELFAFFSGESTLVDAIAKIKQNSRNYAKRQFTWFSNKTKGHMIQVQFDAFDQTVNEAITYIDQYFK
ncbi:MAG TPA: tRNA (adenosine(37)-N6)-dimethylallyltransferase MiaA [Bacilli bacterium]|nr:tRNA (adenosine(37)-N6)-dimethylallyltransferase MiaA [Bacilli bacterium]